MSEEYDEIVKTGRLAKVLGVTTETIRQRKKERVLEEAGRGKYYLAKNVQAYIEYVANGRKTGQAASKKTQVDVERARKLRLENDKAEKLLLDVGDVREVMARALVVLRQHIEALPDRLAPIITGKEKQSEVHEEIDKEARQALRTCADELESFGKFERSVQSVKAGSQEKS